MCPIYRYITNCVLTLAYTCQINHLIQFNKTAMHTINYSWQVNKKTCQLMESPTMLSMQYVQGLPCLREYVKTALCTERQHSFLQHVFKFCTQNMFIGEKK